MMHHIDTHCHLNFDAYDEDRAAVIDRAAEHGVPVVINPGIDQPSSEAAIALSQAYPGIFAAAGIHPNSSANFTAADLDWIETLARAEKVIAIGEIGLDYHWDKSPKAQQFAAFEGQLDLARRLEMPVIIHNREASDDVMRILEAWVHDLPATLRNRPGVLHSFSASTAIAERALAAGFYLGFTGPVTFKKADELRDVARQVPLDRMLVETDGPFLTPAPHRGKRNEPAYIPFIAAALASVKQISEADMAHTSTQNAIRLFQLPDDVWMD
jgi:TatD DNase family protein